MPTPFTSPALKNDYIPTHPGKSDFVEMHHNLIVPFSEGEYGGFPLHPQFGGVHILTAYGNGSPYTTTDNTTTADGTGSVAPGLNGLTFTCSNGTENATVLSKRNLLTAAGQFWFATATFQAADAVNTSWLAGFVTSTSTIPLNTAPADGVYVAHGTDAVLKMTVIENTNAAVTQNLSNSANNTWDRVTIKFYLGSSAATSWGEVWVNGTRYSFTAAVTAALYKVVGTTAATLAFNIGQKSAGAGRVSKVAHWYAGVLPGLSDGFGSSIQ